MKVFIADRNIEGAEETVRELNQNGQFAWPVQVDVSDWESQEKGFAAAVKELGHIDYVFASAGITETPFIPGQPAETGFTKPNLAVWNVNGTGALYSTALAVQQFRRQKPNKYGFRGKSKCEFHKFQLPN
jgi:NAD(P)-dependent dehydrogenase (short-subunit alcohol dehydrogenase family)